MLRLRVISVSPKYHNVWKFAKVSQRLNYDVWLLFVFRWKSENGQNLWDTQHANCCIPDLHKDSPLLAVSAQCSKIRKKCNSRKLHRILHQSPKSTFFNVATPQELAKWFSIWGNFANANISHGTILFPTNLHLIFAEYLRKMRFYTELFEVFPPNTIVCRRKISCLEKVEAAGKSSSSIVYIKKYLRK